jgi:outer membrane protein assembly factor BamB
MTRSRHLLAAPAFACLVLPSPADFQKPVKAPPSNVPDWPMFGGTPSRDGQGSAGVLLGVDLLTHSLVWAHAYSDAPPAPAAPPAPIRGRIPGAVAPTASSEWKASAPVVQDGKVIFTAPDGPDLKCLHLRNGAEIWKVKRGADDVYLAGRVVIVGKKDVRALALTDGKELWRVPTGLPSGRGAALKNNPPPEVKARAEAKLFDAMTELLQRDFGNGEKYLDEYRRLCAVAPANPAEAQAAKQETQRRMANFRSWYPRARTSANPSPRPGLPRLPTSAARRATA